MSDVGLVYLPLCNHPHFCSGRQTASQRDQCPHGRAGPTHTSSAWRVEKEFHHAQGSASGRRIMRRRLVSHRSRSMRRRLRAFGMSPDLRRSADHEPAGLSLVPAQRPNEFVSAFANKRTPTVSAAACKSPLVAECRLGAAAGRSASHHSREGTGRTRSFSCYACSGCYSPDHAHSRAVGSEKFGCIHEQ